MSALPNNVVPGRSRPHAKRSSRREGGVLVQAIRDLLFQCAVLGASCGDRGAVARIRPTLLSFGFDAAKLGLTLAIIALQRDDAEECLRILEIDVLSVDPEWDLALAVQACAWKRLARAEWRSQASSLLSSSSDPLVRSIARIGL